MTLQEEIELIVNTAYLSGCGSAYATAIAGMQESEKHRLSCILIYVMDCGRVELFERSKIGIGVACRVFGAVDKYDAEPTINKYLKEKERERLAELVTIIKEQSPN